MYSPDQISTKSFMGSVFRNTECEIVLRNIVLLQENQSPNEWTPFSWEDYKGFCTHRVSEKERGVLKAFVNGGKPVWNSSAYLQSGWLSFEDDKYSFTENMITMLGENYSGVTS